MIGFLVIGAVGLLVVVASLVFGDLLDGAFEGLDVDGGGVLSTPVIGSFVAAFGFGGALAMYATGLQTLGAALSGLVSGLVVGGLALMLTNSLMNMPTDESVRVADLIGKRGTVITRIPEGGLGEITLSHLGQLMKMNARSPDAVPAGATVEVTAVTSTSSVLVRPVDGSSGVHTNGSVDA